MMTTKRKQVLENAISQLRAVRRLVEHGWTQHEYARDTDGKGLFWLPQCGKFHSVLAGPSAIDGERFVSPVEFCAVGAFLQVCRGSGKEDDDEESGSYHKPNSPAFTLFRKQLCIDDNHLRWVGDVVSWNDNKSRCKADVLNAIDDAIRSAEEETDAN